jgi:probable F420-dependent oxidoreductase
MNSWSIKPGQIGIWTAQLDYQPAAKAKEVAAELEQLGFGAIWFPESTGREALTNAGLLLGATNRIVIATGIANIYARDAVTTAAGQKTLAEAYPGRFLLGLGVSHIPLVEQIRGHSYGKPVASMRAYLDGMDRFLPRSATQCEFHQSLGGSWTSNAAASRRAGPRCASVFCPAGTHRPGA